MGESIFADYIAATPMPNPAEAAEILFDGLEKGVFSHRHRRLSQSF